MMVERLGVFGKDAAVPDGDLFPDQAFDLFFQTGPHFIVEFGFAPAFAVCAVAQSVFDEQLPLGEDVVVGGEEHQPLAVSVDTAPQIGGEIDPGKGAVDDNGVVKTPDIAVDKGADHRNFLFAEGC